MSQFKADKDIQSIDAELLHSIFPFIDIDEMTKFEKSYSLQTHQMFFQKYCQDNKNNKKFSSKIQIKEIENANDFSHKYNLFFDLNDVNFVINHQGINNEEIEREREIFLKTKSDFILHSDINKSDQKTFLPYIIGSTIEEIIDKNQESHIINDSDKILWAIEILLAMSDLYNENSDSKNYNFYHGNISDQSFFIDSMKNAYLFSISENKRHQYFQITKNHHNQQKTDLSFLQEKKIEDLNSIGILLKEIFEEKTPEKEHFTNSSIQFYRMHHAEIQMILSKFPNCKGIYTEFKSIISDIKKTRIYGIHQEEIEKRLEKAKTITPLIRSSFHTLIFSELGGIFDIKPICIQLFTQLRDQSEKGSDYYLFFNLLLHIFFPDQTQFLQKIDYVEILNAFTVADNLITIISTLLNKYLPNEEECQSILNQIVEDKIITAEEKVKFSNIETIIKNEIGGKDNNQSFAIFLQKIMQFYFPDVKTETNKSQIFDYFGVINFLRYKDDLLRIAHPTISEKNIERINSVSNTEKIENFFKKLINQNSKFCVSDFVQELDSSLITHKLFFDANDASFYLNRNFFYGGDVNDFKKKVQYQDELFTKINYSKYIFHLDPETNRMKQDVKSSSADIPFMPTTLLRLIQKNGHTRAINDSDKILWAIQIASALKDLQEYQDQNQQEHHLDFRDCIYDNSFFIDSMKNIYLGTLAYCTERENIHSNSDGPVYFCSFTNPSYIYTYGVLLNEIITEIEPKNLFGNISRQERIEKLKKGYSEIEEFEKTGQKWYDLYGEDLKNIVNSCLKNEITEFRKILELLKQTKLYKKYKYIIDKREKEAKPIDSSRKCSFKSLLIEEVSGITDINHIFIKFFETLSLISNDHEFLFCKILKDLEHIYPPINYFQAIHQISEAASSE